MTIRATRRGRSSAARSTRRSSTSAASRSSIWRRRRRWRSRATDPLSSATALKNMVELPGGAFRMGSDRFYPDHVTWAERAPDAEDYPDADPDDLVPGSLVFRKTEGPVDLRDFRN